MASKFMGEFKNEYKKLNPAQRKAVDTVDGPVMVVAGPGTGKTQVLALRIGNILLKTDTKADGILCLTFTNSAVRAMRERLRRYIGPEASKIKIATFHGFGLEILQKHHEALGLAGMPELLDEKDAVALFDEILQGNVWEHIRPRADSARYFRDLKNLITILKRERIAPETFEDEIQGELRRIENDPLNVSSRGETKGEMKKDAERKIESFRRTLEAVKFYSLYEAEKKERNLFDYEDILEALNRMVDGSAEVRDYIRENFLYVLIDEHQDSSGVQNEFLAKVWAAEEKPNIFVVGDDRQLIYGFGGASLEYFKNFKNAFGEAKLIVLTENYRSTQRILDSADNLLQSVFAEGKLKSNRKGNHSLRLIEANYPRDEIIACALEIKERISTQGGPASGGENGSDPGDFAVLVPKNRQVRNAVSILRDLGVPTSSLEALDLFDLPEAGSFLRVLKIIANPGDSVALAESFFDPLSGISPIAAHEFIQSRRMRDFSLLRLAKEKDSLFAEEDEASRWLGKLKSWLAMSAEPVYSLVQKIGAEFLLDTAMSHEELLRRIEALRTILHLILFQAEKSPESRKLTLAGFLDFLGRIKAYGEHLPLAAFETGAGVKVLTLHGSKGLEFDYVWIAHLDERSFAGHKASTFSLPESIQEKVERRDEEVLKRELYVAVTRAKRFCAISYALKSHTGGAQELARIVYDWSGNLEKQSAEETEKIILKADEQAYVKKNTVLEKRTGRTRLEDLSKLVARDYAERKVSVSLLNNFFECPWKWYFRNLLQLPESMEESLEFGSMVHGSIDAVLKLDRKPSGRELEDIVLRQAQKSNFGDDRKQKELAALALKVVSRWVGVRWDEISKKRKNEESVSVADEKFHHLTLYGKIDLIENLPARHADASQTGGDARNVRVTDFKTGSARKKRDIEKMDEEGRMGPYLRQLAMYSYLIRQSSKARVAVCESRLEFLEAKSAGEAIYDTLISEKHLDLLLRDIKDYDESIKMGTWHSRPCYYNSYGKATWCVYCRMAEIYKNPKGE